MKKEQIIIPKGYEYLCGTENEGLVIQSKEGNQFVWVPGGETKQDGYCEGFFVSRYEISKESNTCYVSMPGKYPVVDISYAYAQEIADLMHAKIMSNKQFERIVRWVLETGDKTEYQVYVDSSDFGNYRNTGPFRMSRTGENPKWMTKNIDNLAGNVYTWTSTGDDKSKIIRGGCCNLNGDYVPLARQARSYLDCSRYYLGLRVVL